LLKSKAPLTDINEDDYFSPTMAKGSFNQQIAFVKKHPKDFFEFKVIEIISERTIKEHCTFIHPVYKSENPMM